MASPNDNVSMALFCDFENVALGVRDANYDKFDIKPVLERLLLKGSIVVKKAYCDWDRYKGFKAPMHEANFELIEIPHVRQSGKNSADIRMVVDALDLCYTKSHVDTFVIISGDSDFSPLVSKLRENAKKVIGVGVKQSTSDLLVANCDEFIFYDDLVRESRRAAAKRDPREAQPAVKRSPEEEKRRREEMDKRRNQAMEIVEGTFDALVSERGDSGKIWASVLKEAIKRRKPDFSESYYGFRTFGNLLEEAKARGLLEFGRDEKSGAYVYRSSGIAMGNGAGEASGAGEGAAEAVEGRQESRQDGRQDRSRGRGRGGRGHGERGERHERGERAFEPVADSAQEMELDGGAEGVELGDAVDIIDIVEVVQLAEPQAEAAEPRQDSRRSRGNRGGRKQAEQRALEQPQPQPEPLVVEAVQLADMADAPEEGAAVVLIDDEAAAVDGQEAAKPARGKGGRTAKATTGKAKATAKPAAKAATKSKAKANVAEVTEIAEVAEVAATEASTVAADTAAEPAADAPAATAKPARKPQPRGRRPRKSDKSAA